MDSHCPACGSPVGESERLCISCGWDFAVRGLAADAPPRTPPPPSEAAKLPPPEDVGFHEASSEAERPPSPQAERRLLPTVVAVVAGAAVVAAIVLNVQRSSLEPDRPAESAARSDLFSTDSPVAVPAAPRVLKRPAAVFAGAPRLRLVLPVPSDSTDTPRVSSSVASAPLEEPTAAKGPTWAFQGVVFDLMTGRGVFAANLSFRNGGGTVVGKTSTNGEGRYKVVLPVGGLAGYALKIEHGDYTERYIDTRGATDAIRQATDEERKILMQGAASNRPWVGDSAKTLRRDLGLVPLERDGP